MKIADYLIAYLAACGVRHIFGYPGSPLVPLLAALKRQNAVQWVLMRHENAAALAAGAQAKLTGTLGVCLATSGPGALQTVCGVADAHLDRAPLLALTGVVARAQQGHWGFQDVDQTSLYTTILEQSLTCASAEQLVALLRKLTGHALLQQHAVHLALPIDVLEEDIDLGDSLFDLSHLRPLNTVRNGAPRPDEVQRAVDVLASTHPVIVVGRRAAGAGKCIEELAGKLDAPIVSTLDGKGVVDESHDNYLGVLGMFGHPAVVLTRKIIEDADCILSFGVDDLRAFLSDARHRQTRQLVQCTTTATTISLEYQSEAILVGDPAEIARMIGAGIKAPRKRGTIARLSRKRELILSGAQSALEDSGNSDTTNPLSFLLALNRYLDERHIVIVDTGSHTLWASLFLKLAKGQPFLVSGRLGTMGFSIPALIAAQVTHAEKRAVAICGDGGLGMTGMELATAVQYRLPFVLVVINNGVLQNVMAQQKEPFGTHIHNPDIVQFARSFGASAAYIDRTTDIDKVLQEAMTVTDRPFVIDVRCNPALLAPFNKWEQGIENAGV